MSNLILNYQYNVAAFVLTIILLVMLLMRSITLNKSGTIYMYMLLCNLVCILFGVVSDAIINQTASSKYSSFICIMFFYFFNILQSCLYLKYIDAKCKIGHIRRYINIVTFSVMIFFFFILATTSVTKLIIWIDNDNIYKGQFIQLLYIVPITVIIMTTLILTINNYKQIDKFQSVIIFICSLFVSMPLITSLDTQTSIIGAFSISVILMIIYIVFENPAYYKDLDTRCLNSKAFHQTLKSLNNSNAIQKYQIWYITCVNSEVLKQKKGAFAINRTYRRLSIILSMISSSKIFSFGNGNYIILNKIYPKNNNLISKIKNSIKKYFPDMEYEFILINDNNQDFETIKKIIDYRIVYDLQKYYNLPSNDFLNEINTTNIEKEKIIESIKRGIKNKSFEIYYQPIFNNKTKTFSSAEALLRYEDPVHGKIDTETLIKTAEENGFIDQITEIVLHDVCKFISSGQLHKYGIEYIEINISPENCKEKNIVDKINIIRNRYKISPSMINLEITETANTQNNSNIEVNLNAINKEGIELSIDDYGTGFASSNYLIKMPVSLVKIDKSILWAAMQNSKAMLILESTINLLIKLEKKIVIEGIETEEMVSRLSSICENIYFQGHYYSRAIPANEFIDFLKKHNNEIALQ